MNNVTTMHGSQAIRQGLAPGKDLDGVEWPPLCKVVDTTARAIFHHQIEMFVVLEVVKKLDDMGMIERRKMVHFLDQHRRIADRFTPELLDGNTPAVDQHVLGQPDSPKAAFPQGANRPIFVIKRKDGELHGAAILRRPPNRHSEPSLFFCRSQSRGCCEA